VEFLASSLVADALAAGHRIRMFVHIPGCYFRVAILVPKRNQFVVARELKEAAQGSIGGKRTCPLKATSVSKSKSDSIAERVQQIILSFIVLVAYSKAFDLVAEVIA
jgi:hypothetical protein